jgi:PIN domain nuclease of toxin-antitoxin system
LKYLFDTHLLLWAAGYAERLPAAARAILQEPANDILFSAASIWEVAIKAGLGREDFRVAPGLLRHGLLGAGYGEMAIAGTHVVAVEMLPPLHKDPFDRILVAQAMVEDVMLVTSDPIVARYPGSISLV